MATAKDQYAPVNDTDSGVALVAAETQRLSYEDWWYPERESATSERSTLLSSQNGSDTEASEITRYTSPVRKSTLGVKLTGHRVKMLQQWECIIQSVDDECVCCEMHDLTDESQPVEYAEIFIQEFSEYDRPLLAEGTAFYWSIGHVRRSNGQIIRNSEIRVRRMPKLNRSQQAEISTRVARLGELIIDS
ncbi:MAG: hypothetical protein NXI32_14375 [bacterium]|nr:hypothetical protein [bacterium]